jgi:hypothetical protein
MLVDVAYLLLLKINKDYDMKIIYYQLKII